MPVGYWWESRKERATRKTKKWVNNIKMDLRLMELGGVDSLALALDIDQRRTLMKTVINFQVPYNFGKFLSS
jgi:hypothetical protein